VISACVQTCAPSSQGADLLVLLKSSLEERYKIDLGPELNGVLKASHVQVLIGVLILTALSQDFGLSPYKCRP